MVRSRYEIEAWMGDQHYAGSFAMHSMDKTYIKACTRAFMFELKRQGVRPDRMRMRLV